MKVLEHFFGILAIVTVIYAMIMILYAGIGTEFLWFWVSIGVGSSILHFWLAHLIKVHGNVPKALAICFFVIVGIGLALFILLETMICSTAFQKPKKQADAILVLGAQVRGTRITRSLRYRLDATIEYLEHENENPDIVVIVSGGQGEGEEISEAQAMKDYLVQAGIDEERILCEHHSTNTVENFQYSKQFIDRIFSEESGKPLENTNILVVTNGFHLYRALRIADANGIVAEGLSAQTDPILELNYYVREAAAVLKDYLWGNISLW